MPLAASSYYTYRTPHGPLTIQVTGGRVSVVTLRRITLIGEMKPCELSNVCANQLLEYFAGKRTAFDIPMLLSGTPFQKDVWQAIEKIPYGQTRTYEEIATAAGRPESFRMVGAAVKKNPLAILVPAHRVVNASGKVPGTDRSAQLRAAMIELERRHA